MGGAAEMVIASVPAEATGTSALDPEAAAREAGLRYVHDRAKGYTRVATPHGFAYKDHNGDPITDERILARIRALAIPPAYRDVWICRDPNGHLQAVGRDARGRKQYRYHPRWRAVRDEAKYHKMDAFARALPRIRRRIAKDIALRGLPREKILAAIVRLLEQTLVRIGNEEYAKSNHSFGLTTLRHRHVRVKGQTLIFDFRAKHGIASHIDLQDRQLARIVAKCQELPGQELFQYRDPDGNVHAIGSEDVNRYLQEISGDDITAKDFRTWSATHLAALALCKLAGEGTAPTKANVATAATAVAKMLGNTPAICRKCYIHPGVIEGYLDGTLVAALSEVTIHARRNNHGLSANEKSVSLYLAGLKP